MKLKDVFGMGLLGGMASGDLPMGGLMQLIQGGQVGGLMGGAPGMGGEQPGGDEDEKKRRMMMGLLQMMRGGW